MCDKKPVCCTQLEAESLHSNEKLLSFEVRSKDIKWKEYVEPLRMRGPPFYLQRQFELISNYREPIGEHNRREVLLCHDMMGNYLEDKHYNSSKKFDYYRFYHWACIDYFCYFSHNYITIPPCGWINAAHKNGVRVLGTFITEGSIGSKLLHEVLKSPEMVNNIVAAMVKLCTHFGFEGWLVNVECKVNADAMENLYYFINKLRDRVEIEVDYGWVFWYDSVIDTGELQWQNEINAKNVRFFRSTDAMLVNYSWNDLNLDRTAAICEQEKMTCQCVFFGIDVFGRGQTAKFQSKQTLARIVSRRFSSCIFAPAWTYETLQQYNYNIKLPNGDDAVNDAFLLRNEKFWWSMWQHMATHPYRDLPFYSDFCLGSGKNKYVNGLPMKVDAGGGSFFNLSQQAMQPSVPLYQLAEHCYEDAFNGGSCLRITEFKRSFRLFATDFQVPHAGLVFAYAYKLQRRDGEFDCVLRLCTTNNSRDCYLFLGDYYNTVSMQKGRCYVSAFKPKFNELLKGPLETTQIPKHMAFSKLAANGWRVRYYVLAFDVAVQIKDIGIMYRRTHDAVDTAYLGAVFMNDFNANEISFPPESNVAVIQIMGRSLLN